MDDWRFFEVAVCERVVLSPSLLRFVLCGEGVERLGREAPDRYLKVFFPTPQAALDSLPQGGDWYQAYLAQAAGQRVAMRTFTISAVYPARRALAIDFALHGPLGPAACWALQARIGDRLRLYASLVPRWGRGYAWRLPAGVEQVLVLADETALPAAAGIVETLASMPAPALTVLLEVPQADDRLVPARLGAADLRCYPRQQVAGRRGYGQALQAALAQWLGCRPGESAVLPLPATDEPLWQLAGREPGRCYVWIAAETGLAAALRRQLLAAGLPRDAISCMGYWRQGRAQH